MTSRRCTSPCTPADGVEWIQKAFRAAAVAAVWVALTASATAASAAEKVRIKFVPKDPAALTVVKEQVSFSVSVLDGTNYKTDENVWAHFQIAGKGGATIQFDDVACQFPFLNVTVQNNSDQTLKIRGKGSSDEVVVAMDDEQGNTINALTKDKMRDSSRATYSKFTQSRAANPAEALTQLMDSFDAMLNKLRFLTEDVTILPGRKAKFYTCFEYVPGASDDQEINEKFFKTRKEVSIGFYDVPVQRDAAGNVKKKTSYQFAFKVVKQ
jgi:hypothetical protein